MEMLSFLADGAAIVPVAQAASILSTLIVIALPLILVAFAGMSAERSGVINLGLEGMMVLGAFAGFFVLKMFTPLVESHPSLAQLAVLVAILASALLGWISSLLLSFASIKLKANQVIVGTAINIIAPALATLVAWAIFGQGMTAMTDGTPAWVSIGKAIPQSSLPSDPSVGELVRFFFSNMFFQNFFLTTPIILVLIVLVSLFLFKTKTGLRLRACGENPQAADTVGINVGRMRFLGTSLSGILSGLGGFAICLAIGYEATVIGFGFLALAVMIFGNWKPLNIVLGGFVFAFARVLANSGILPDIPGLTRGDDLYLCLPYLLTLIVLVFASRHSHAPKAEGIPYDKSAR